MTVVRIAALAILLGSSVTALVWFAWGAIQNLSAGRAKAEAPTPEAKPHKPA